MMREGKNRQEEECLRAELIGANFAETGTFGKNYLVEAGAGAGKTYIMVNRIVNQLLSGTIEPGNLAAITFTEKATQEMQDRIDRAVLERLRDAEQTSGPDSAEALRLRELRDRIDELQISTIHGFCRKLLLTMPYESALGPDFELKDDIEPVADDYFDRAVKADSAALDALREQTGIPYDDLKENFVRLCESGAELVYANSEELCRIRAETEERAGLIYLRLHDEAKFCNVKNPTSKTVQEIETQIREVLRLKDGSRNEFVQALLRVMKPLSKEKKAWHNAIIRVLPGAIKDNEAVMGIQLDRIVELQSEANHAVCMSFFRDMIAGYQDYKKQARIASQNDVLRYTRDMLYRSAEARQYFHDRYRTIYVDEMQDTDPIQAQILFYLTTAEEKFDPAGWKECRPVPGSLFLVGDPKQAIYRFRGADISVYMDLAKIFDHGGGENVRLHFNYRSSSEITDFADRCFRNVLKGNNNQEEHSYQAEYASMTPVQGTSSNARLIAYETPKENDAACVAAFIAELTGSGVTVGIGEAAHSAKYSDFMILTRFNESTERYVRTLAERGIPCNMAGTRSFADVTPIVGGARILRHLLDRGDETALAAVLTAVYGIPLPDLRVYRARAGWLTASWRPVQKALLAEGSLAPAFERIFSAMAELDRLAWQAKHAPAMTALEHLFFRTGGLWRQEPPEDRSGDYAMVCQFLTKLADLGSLSFPALAEEALKLTAGKTKRELLLEEQENCVRVMNLHKAKGLEAEIIILAADETFNHKIFQHSEFAGNTVRLHSCFISIDRHSQYKKKIHAAWERNWSASDGPEQTEKKFLDAEAKRLLYVAVTRAKTCLIVNTAKGGVWTSLTGGFEKDREMEDNDPWADAVSALNGGSAAPVPDAERLSHAASAGCESAPASPVIDVRLSDMEASLRRADNAAAVCGTLCISPSLLEKSRRSIHRRETEEEIETVVSPEEPAVPAAVPHGPDWGTIVHRVMELTVRSGRFTAEAIRVFARQAVSETLGDCADLTAGQRTLLLGSRTLAPGETLPADLADRAAEAADFLRDPAAPLRQLLAGAACYPELPFVLREADRSSALSTQVRAVADQKGADTPDNILLTGIMDLAVHAGESWAVVDYKTDLPLPSESEEAYIDRLKANYTPQLLAYREVLTRLDRGPVTQVYLCALSLRGRLIPLL